MKLSVWAKQKGITYRTAYSWFKQGLIEQAIQMPTGTIIIDNTENVNTKENIVVYCRVSNQSRKNELEYQVNRCLEFCQGKGFSVKKTYKEVASGMNDKRKELTKMLDSVPTIIVIEHKDRLTRFGFNYLENLLNKLGCKIIVVNQDYKDENDLIKDMVSIMTSFCCRLYGLRRGTNKAKKIKEIIHHDKD